MRIRKNIYNFNQEELENEIFSSGLKKYTAHQIIQWLYKKFVSSFQEMTDISALSRALLEEKFSIKLPAICNSVISSDNTTIKYVFELEDKNIIETVLIKEADRKTICVSSQVGCGYGCKFCLTGKIRFIRNLESSEIVGQIVRLLKLEKQITNIVFMGMGEPLSNFKNVVRAIQILTNQKGLCISSRRITLSTCGLVPELLKFNSLNIKINLAISLNAVDNEKRNQLMPVNKKYPLEQLLNSCKKLTLSKRERIIFEYILIKDINDSFSDANKLAELLKGIPCKINLIAYNENPYLNFYSPSPETVNKFQQILIDKYYSCFVRKSKGSDIFAACGQLGALKSNH